MDFLKDFMESLWVVLRSLHINKIHKNIINSQNEATKCIYDMITKHMQPTHTSVLY